jgi:uncharacterized protein YhaN
MRIRGWQIEGFGIFHDFHVPDLPRGLVIVHGPNEAGKSTLLAFLRGVLFGFADRRTPESLYPPLRGGRHGGALLVEGLDGVYRVERTAGRRVAPAIVRPDGSQGQPADLQRLLGGADETLFRSVFAFSLDELTQMQSLSSEEVRGHIFSAGIAGAGRSARTVIEELEREAATLLKPRAGTIRDLIHKAQDLRGQIRSATATATDYPAVVREEQDTLREVERLRVCIGQSQASLNRTRKLIELWPTESELQQVFRELADLPVIPAFRADAEQQLATVKAQLEAVRSAAETATARLAELQAQREGVRPEARLGAIAADVQALADELANQRERLQRMVGARQSLETAGAAVRQAFEELGPGWTEERVATMDVALPSIEEVRDWQGQLQAAKEATAVAAQDLRQHGEQCSALEYELQQVRADIDQEPASAAADRLDALATRLESVGTNVASVVGIDARSLACASATYEAVARLRAGEREEERLQQLLEATKTSLDGIEVDATLDPVHAVIAAVARHLDAQRQRLANLDVSARTVADQQAVLDKALAGLGPGWNESGVLALRCDFDQVRCVRQFADDLSTAAARSETAARDVEAVRRGISAREKDLARVKDRLAGQEPTSAEELARKAARVRSLRTHLAELSELESRIRAEETIKKERARLGRPRSTPVQPVPKWLTPALLLMALLSAAFGAWRVFSQQDVVIGAVLVVLALGLGAAALAARVRAAHISGDDAPRDANVEGEDESTIADLRQRASETRARIVEDTASLGLPSLPSVRDVDECDERLQRERQARGKWDDASAETRELEHELASWRASQEERHQAHETCVRHEQACLSQWDVWKHANGLPQVLSPDAARDFLHEVRTVQERISGHNSASEVVASLQAAIARWEGEARDLVRLHHPGDDVGLDSARLIDAVADLQRRCAEDAQRRRDRARAAEELCQRENELGEARCARALARDAAVGAVKREVGRLCGAWDRAEPVRQQRRRELDRAARHLEEAQAQWQAWQMAKGIDRALSPEGVLDFFRLVLGVRDAIRRRDEANGVSDAIELATRQWIERAEAVAQAASLAPSHSAPDAWLDVVRALSTRCQADAEARRKATALDDEIERAVANVSQSEERLKKSDAEFLALLLEIGVASEEEFRTKLVVSHTRSGLEQRARELGGRIAAGLGRGEGSTRLREELATGRLSDWEVDHAGRSEEGARLQEAYDQAIRVNHDVGHRRQALEDASDIASLEIEHQGVVSELVDGVERWKRLRVARGLVTETLAEFERTRQPQVLAAASEYFGRVTTGRYAQILQDEEGRDVAIIDRLGARRTTAELSRGTREQLYLCIRLGLAHEFGRRSEPLPLVMDDVLVNFDPGRAREMAQELLEFGQTNQVLLFTCHPFTRDVFRDIDNAVPVIELPLEDVPESVVAGQRTRAEVQASEPSAHDDEPEEVLHQRVIAALLPGELGMSDLCARLGCSVDRLRPVLTALRESGMVEMSGQRRGARYRLASEADASEA